MPCATFRAVRPLLMLLLTLLAACTASPAPNATALLRWGGDAEGGAPFVEADAADPRIVRGFDVEIAGMIAEGLGRRPQFTQVAWASIEQSVARGDFDIGMSGLEDRPELRTRFAVSVPYYEFREVLAVRPADTARYRTLDDLAGKRVATLGATQAYTLLLEAKANVGVMPVSYDDNVHPYADLLDGRVEAVLLDHVLAERALLRSPGFVIQPTPIARGHYVAVFAPGNAALRDSANVILRARMADGSLERTFRRWGVWDDQQAQHFRRLLADSVATDRTVQPSGARDVTSYLPSLARAAAVTLVISVAAMALAIVLGGVVAGGRIYGGPVVRGLLLAYVEVVRGTPVLLQLFVLYYGLSGIIRLPALAAAILGLGLNYAAYEAEVYRAALQAVPRAQLEAARTLGLSEWQVFRLVRGPQALRFALAPMTNDFVALLKDSSLVSVITVVELTKQTAIYATNAGSWVVPGMLCAVMYLIMSLPLSRLARRLEARWHVA